MVILVIPRVLPIGIIVTFFNNIAMSFSFLRRYLCQVVVVVGIELVIMFVMVSYDVIIM